MISKTLLPLKLLQIMVFHLKLMAQMNDTPTCRFYWFYELNLNLQDKAKPMKILAV